MPTIKVPKPGKGSFNKDRPISDLLRSQMRHLHEVEKTLPHYHRSGKDVEALKTEGEASEYIRTMTARLHKHEEKVTVPRPAPGSFNKHRPISDLLRRQIEHFRHVEENLPEDRQTKIDVLAIRTEHEAAAYLKKITAILHGNIPPEPSAEKNMVAAPRAARAKTPKRTRKGKGKK